MFLMALTIAAVEPPPRPMSVDIVRDPITDHVRAYATVREGGDRLVVSCDSSSRDGPQVAFHGRRWLARGNIYTGFGTVTYRFDNQRPRRMMWHIDNRQARLTGRRRVASFLTWLTAAQKVAIRTRDLENHRYDMTFRLVGARWAVEQALAACGHRARASS